MENFAIVITEDGSVILWHLSYDPFIYYPTKEQAEIAARKHGKSSGFVQFKRFYIEEQV